MVVFINATTIQTTPNQSSYTPLKQLVKELFNLRNYNSLLFLHRLLCSLLCSLRTITNIGIDTKQNCWQKQMCLSYSKTRTGMK